MFGDHRGGPAAGTVWTGQKPFREYLLRASQAVSFKFEGTAYKITIEDVKLFPQGYSAIALHPELVQNEPSVLLMDIGGWTVDLMRLDNRVPNAASCRSLELGMIRCLDEIREQVRRDTGLSVTDAQAERVLAGQPCSMFNNKEEVVQAVQGVQRKLLLFAGEADGPAGIQQRIDEIEVTMTSLLELAARNDAAELCEAKFKELTQEKKQLLKRLQEVQQRWDADQEKRHEIQRLMQAIDADTVDISEFSDDLVRRIVERVTVLSKDEIEVRLVGGYSKIEKLII